MEKQCIYSYVMKVDNEKTKSYGQLEKQNKKTLRLFLTQTIWPVVSRWSPSAINLLTIEIDTPTESCATVTLHLLVFAFLCALRYVETRLVLITTLTKDTTAMTLTF